MIKLTEHSRLHVRVFTAMVADLYHPGHVNFLRQARNLGDHLTVGLVSDQRAQSYKRLPILSFTERKEVLLSCRYVDDIIDLSENVTNEFMQLNNFQIRAYATLDDDEERRNFSTLWKDMDRNYFRRIEYTKDISTSDIIGRILERHDV